MEQNVVKTLPPRNWRTNGMHQRYVVERQSSVANDTCIFCTERPEFEFKFWYIIKNLYPYDAVAKRHDLLYPKRHIAKFDDLNEAELAELAQLKETSLNTNYAFLMEAMPKNKSIPGHFHFHLIEPKVID